MKNVLILGGTAWLGREIARSARDRGARVVCLARGASGEVPEGVELVRADRGHPGAYDGLAGDWDEVVELSSEPGLVSTALDALADRAAHWTLISSVSVYAEHNTPNADESAELVEPVNLGQYADAKVAAELASSARLGDRLLIARPGLIAGPGDPSDRLGYWPARLDRPGPVLTPTLAERFVQFIDVADLAEWVTHAGATGVTGRINAVGEVHRFGDFLDAARRVAGGAGEFVAASDEALLEQGVAPWAGPRSLPLWLPPHHDGFARRDGSAFAATGGSTRSLHDTLRRVLEDERSRGLTRARKAGLTEAEEREVLAAVR